MKSKKTNSKKRIEHRGFDFSATKNYDLEVKMVKKYNHQDNDAKASGNDKLLK